MKEYPCAFLTPAELQAPNIFFTSMQRHSNTISKIIEPISRLVRIVLKRNKLQLLITKSFNEVLRTKSGRYILLSLQEPWKEQRKYCLLKVAAMSNILLLKGKFSSGLLCSVWECFLWTEAEEPQKDVKKEKTSRWRDTTSCIVNKTTMVGFCYYCRGEIQGNMLLKWTLVTEITILPLPFQHINCPWNSNSQHIWDQEIKTKPGQANNSVMLNIA